MLLDEADAVASRRDRATDRRAMARLQIGQAVVMAVYLIALAVVLRSDVVMVQVLVFAFLIWSQISVGMAQRWGMQRRLAPSRWPLLLVGGVLLTTALVMVAVMVFVPSFPISPLVVTAAAFAVAVGGDGAVSLFRARHDPRPTNAAHVVMGRAARWGTILVGVALGVLVTLTGVPEGLVRSVVVLIVVLVLAAWLFACSTEIGLPGIGAVWRWPQMLALAVAGAVLVVTALLDLGWRGLAPVTVGLGAVVLLLFVGVSFAKGHPRRG